jgi:glycosyltransferase involved in cell wall biosynthesis
LRGGVKAPVAINARAAARGEIGGVERWARELEALLPAVHPGRYAAIRPPRALAHRAGHVWEQLVLPVRARRARVLLSPANLAPLSHPGNVVVIHDAAPFREPSWYGRAYGRWHRALIPRIARRAKLVFVPSEFVRSELIDLFDIPPERIRAIAPGVDARFASPGDPAPVLARLDLDGRPYVLALGTEGERKNLRLLDQIAPQLATSGLDVVVAGSRRAYIAISGEGLARRIGYVDDADLPALYAGAIAFAMPSLYEGFGLPCIEAMAAGTPVVASDRAALPEACGGAALLADPADPDAFVSALLDATGAERHRLIEAGRERAAQLTWRRTAEEIDSALDPLLA